MSGNVVSVRGGKVHRLGMWDAAGAFPMCRTGAQTNSGTKYRNTDAPVDCKTCLSYEPAPTAEGDSMVAKNGNSAPEVDVDALMSDFHTLLDATRKAAAEGDAEALAQHKVTSEEIITQVPTKLGKRTKMRNEFTEAAKAPEAPKVLEGVVQSSAEVAQTDYTSIKGLPELVDMGAQRMADGVRAHQESNNTARGVAEVLLDMRLRILNKDGVPDLTGRAHVSKMAASAMYDKAGAPLREGGQDIKDAVMSMIGSVQYQMSDVLVNFVRKLDSDPKQYRELFGKVAEAHPDQTPADAVFTFYNISRQSKLEKARERAQLKAKSKAPEVKALTSSEAITLTDEGNGDGDEAAVARVAPEVKAAATIDRAHKLITGLDTSYFDGIKREAADVLEEELKTIARRANELRKLLVAAAVDEDEDEDESDEDESDEDEAPEGTEES